MLVTQVLIAPEIAVMGVLSRDGNVFMTILRIGRVILDMMKPATMPPRFFIVIITLASNMFKKLSILIIGCLLVGGFVFADTTGSQDFVYLFHLYYDNGRLVADRDVQFKYDVIPETFVPETLNTQFPYKGEVVDLKGEIAKTFQFDPRKGDIKFLKGTLSVKAPYVPDGQKVNFSDNQGNQLLSIFVSESSFCNDDGACNSDVGEDNKTCPSDCKTATPVPIVSTQPPTGGIGGGMLKNIIYLIIGLGVVAGGWLGWKWYKRRQEPPTTQFPIPPLPPNNSQNIINQ